MADKLDPHHLVALMSHVFRPSRRLDPTSINLEYGITNTRETSAHTFPVLDAIASICVFEEKSHVVAVALKLDPKEQQIRLTIAENSGFRRNTDHHLKSVWYMLRTLSWELATERLYRRNEEESPDIPENVALALKVKIFRMIYQYCLRKEMKRAGKWWGPLVDFLKELAQRRGGALQGIELNLYHVVGGLNTALQFLRKIRHYPVQGLTDDEWQTVYNHSMWASAEAGLVLADRQRFGCEILAKEFNDSPSSRPVADFQLRRAIEKLTSLTRHIGCLFSFANSPRLRYALKYHMSTATVPEQTRTIAVPKSQEQWERFLEVAAAKKLRWQKGEAMKLTKRFRENIRVCSPHCECVLTQYLTTRHGDSWDNVPAFSYIGVSKLSCSACQVWLEAFNEVSLRKFYTGGSHRKWSWPWGMPTAEESLGKVMDGESLGETLAGKISREYIGYLEEKDLYRPGPDRTFPSLSGIVHHLSDDDIESMLSEFAVKLQEAGGTIGWHLASTDSVS